MSDIFINHLYRENDYKMTKQQVTNEISAGRLAPITKCQPTKTNDCRCLCPICDYYYRTINETTCCHSPICTECYAATCGGICIFCRNKTFSVKGNLTHDQLAFKEEIDEALVDIIEKFPQHKEDIINFYNCGVSVEDICTTLGAISE